MKDIYLNKRYRKIAFFLSLTIVIFINIFLYAGAFLNIWKLNHSEMILYSLIGVIVSSFLIYFFLNLLRTVKLNIRTFWRKITKSELLNPDSLNEYNNCPKCGHNFDVPLPECPKCQVVIEKYLMIEKRRKEKDWKRIRNKAIAVVSITAFITAAVVIGGLWLNKNETINVNYATKYERDGNAKISESNIRIPFSIQGYNKLRWDMTEDEIKSLFNDILHRLPNTQRNSSLKQYWNFEIRNGKFFGSTSVLHFEFDNLTNELGSIIIEIGDEEDRNNYTLFKDIEKKLVKDFKKYPQIENHNYQSAKSLRRIWNLKGSTVQLLYFDFYHIPSHSNKHYLNLSFYRKKQIVRTW